MAHNPYPTKEETMSKSKPTVARRRRLRQAPDKQPATTPNQEPDPGLTERDRRLLKYHGTMLGLSRAKAGLWLLEMIDGGHILDPGINPAPVQIHGLVLENGEVREWLTSTGIDMVAAGVKEAEEAFMKSATPETAMQAVA
jgi:hypothetical protein